MIKKFIDAGLEIKALEDDGTFAGYGSVFNTIDSYNETVAPGAFKDTLADLQGKGRMPALLWQHRSDEPIGVWTSMKEDKTGLYGEGKLALGTQRGREAYELLKMNALSGLSIGFVPREETVDRDEGIVTLTKVDLWETSLVTFPANDSARVSAVKAFGSGARPAPSVVERALREALNMSDDEAKGFMARGYKGLDPKREAEAQELAELQKLLNALP